MDIKKMQEEVFSLKKKLSITIAAHYYQKDEVFEIADITGDSLELAKKASKDKNNTIVFCGVAFMGQSVKVLAPFKDVYMPKIACCSMAKMIDSKYFDDAYLYLINNGLKKEEILPITYINSSVEVKAKVGKAGGMVCTSSAAEKIVKKAIEKGKKVLFVPDRCLGENIAKIVGVKSCVIEKEKCDIKKTDVFCYNGFCAVHQLFGVEEVMFYKKRFPSIKIAVHPECKPEVCALADFVGSTSQLLKYLESLPKEEKVAVGTEFNFVNRARKENTYILSSTKPSCPTMNETTLADVYTLLKSIERGKGYNKIEINKNDEYWAKISLDRMFETLGE
jgi:quinolinate synthase